MVVVAGGGGVVEGRGLNGEGVRARGGGAWFGAGEGLVGGRGQGA